MATKAGRLAQCILAALTFFAHSQAARGVDRLVPSSVTPAQRRALEALEARHGAVQVAFDETRGTIRWLSGRLSGRLTPGESGARRFIEARRSLLRAPSDAFALRGHRVDAAGTHHATFERVVDRIPVLHSTLTIHQRQDGVVTDVTGGYDGDVIVSGDAILSAGEAVSLARGVYSQADAPIRVIARDGARYVPAWRLTARDSRGVWDVIVDAAAPRILRVTSLVTTGFTPATGQGLSATGQTVSLRTSYLSGDQKYYLYDFRPEMNGDALRTSNANHTGEYDDYDLTPFVSTSNAFYDTSAVDAHRHVAAVYDWYWTRHAWSSWNGAGGSLYIVVHTGWAMANAFWDVTAKTLAFGDGDDWTATDMTRCKDVVAHEFTHGVVDGTVGLIYELQSGALNEHIADAYGTFLDPPIGLATDYEMGEKCAGPGLALGYHRHMLHPEYAGDPSHFYDFKTLDNDPWNDYGGVHTNSGIPNKAMALLIEALGVEKTEAIYFQLLYGGYVNAEAQFLDFRNGMISACAVVHGASSSACKEVETTFDLVGLFGPGKAPKTCPSGSVANPVTGCRCKTGHVYDYTTKTCLIGTGGACGDVGEMGSCIGDTLEMCWYGELDVIDCSLYGMTCDFDWDLWQYGCVGAVDACAGVPSYGQCYGNVLQKCVDGQLEQTTCSWVGKVCVETWWGAECQAKACVPSCSGKECGSNGCAGVCGVCGYGTTCDAYGQCKVNATSECGNIDLAGSCQYSTLKYCENGTLTTFDCGSAGLSCVYDPSEAWYECAISGEPSQCGSLTGVGTCVGSTLKYCDHNKTYTVDCAWSGLSCAFDETSDAYGCSGDGGCGGITYVGECFGGTVWWCEGGLQSLDCAADGLVCGYNAAKGYYDCLQPTVPTSCGSVTWAGECQGDTVLWCDGGAIQSVDCAANGNVCGYDPAYGYYTCIPAGPSGCGSVGTGGTCQGNLLVTCALGSLVKTDCGASGQTCAATGSGTYGCVTLSSCGGVTEKGLCAGDLFQLCIGGQIVTIDCAASGQVCAMVSGTGKLGCVASSTCGSVPETGQCAGNVLQVCAGGAVVTADCALQGKVCGAIQGSKSYGCITPVCVPSCVGKDCGDDGCGGSCGACAYGGACIAGQCVSACGTLGFEGQCAGAQLTWCDHGQLLSVDCQTLGPYACAQVPGTTPPSYDCLCTPACDAKSCGDDGCGGECGTCGEGALCQAGQCVCSPDCVGKSCGPDGCGGTCGACGPATACVDGLCYAKSQCAGLGFAGECDGTVLQWCDGGKLVSVDCADLGSYVCGAKPGVAPDDYDCLCAPDCGGTVCGGDGCGGSCGTCPNGESCEAGACVAPPAEDLGSDTSPVVEEAPAPVDSGPPPVEEAVIAEAVASEEAVAAEPAIAEPSEDAGSLAEAAPDAVSPQPPSASGGCAAGQGTGSGAVVLTLMALLALRRRRAVALAVALTLVACAGSEPPPVEGAVLDTVAAETTDILIQGAQCTSDADCATKGQVCDPLPGVCVDCLFGSDCGAGSFRCVDRACVPQTSCTSSLDCDGQVCNPNDGTCVDCLAGTDCLYGVCISNTCKKATTCTSSLQCTAQVCDKDAGYCVACVEDADCPDGRACALRACVDRTPCKSDLACTPNGMVCDKLAGWCVKCLSNAECPEPYHCTTGECVLDVCEAGEHVCDAGAVRECLEDGSAWGAATACGAGQACVLGACKDAICEPGAALCDAGKAGSCNLSGTAIDVTDDCVAKGLVCVAAACVPKVCDPGDPACDGDFGVHNCDATGAAFGPTSACAQGKYCDLGACVAQTCVPGVKSCDGSNVVTCDAKGSGPATSSPCGADEVCLAGACLPKACEPGQKTCKDGQVLTCDATGTEPTLAGCPASETCIAGACAPWVCEPAKAVCEGGVAKVCDAFGGAWAATTVCAVKTEVCVDGVCLAKVCEPSTIECVGDFDYHPCLSPGLAWGLTKSCAASSYCDGGFCLPGVCEPDAVTCDGTSVVTCDAKGSGPAETAPCPAGATCEGGACKPIVCTGGAKTCLAGQLATCNALGTAEALADCPAQHTCLAGECVAWSCEPEKLFCAGSVAKLCDATGTAPSTVKVCAVKTEVCVAGDCVTKVCNPSALDCDGDFAFHTCDTTGAAYGDTKSCPAESYCQDGACLPQTCTPGQATCEGGSLVTCNAQGSGAASSTPCAVGSTCIGATCIPLVCVPGATSCAGAKLLTCNLIGTSLVESACPAGQSCTAGKCANWVCTPGAAYCDGSVAKLCNDIGTVTSVTDTCTASTEVCVAGACFAKVCTPNQTTCDGDFARHTCSADGTSYGATTGCAAGSYCDGGLCKVQACLPLASTCIGSTLVTCNAVGSGYLSQLPCGDGSACIDGACVAAECQPGTKTCQDGKIATCSVTGQDYSLSSCPSQQYCGTGGVCKAWACVPYTIYCTGSVSHTCDGIGSGPLPGGSQDCGASGMTCAGGLCKAACAPSCNGKSCGSDGCTGSCGTCTSGWNCTGAGTCQPVSGAACGSVTVAGYCDAKILVYCDGGKLVVNDCGAANYFCGWVPSQGWYDCVPSGGCTPSCNGKTCGDDGCGGSCGTCGLGSTCTSGSCLYDGCAGYGAARTKVNGHCFAVYTDTRTWQSASDACKALGSSWHLATIGSSADEAAITSLQSSIGDKRVWIGMSDADVEGQWRWVTGEVMSYTFWQPGNPSDTENNEDCGEKLTQATWTSHWNDYICDTKAAYVCESDAGLPCDDGNPATTGDVMTAGICKGAGCTPSCNGKACGDDGCGGSCGSCAPQYACGGSGVPNECGCTPKPFAGNTWSTDFDDGLCGFDQVNMGFQTNSGKMITTPAGDYVAVTSAAAHDGAAGLHIETAPPQDTDQYIIVKHFPVPAKAASVEVWLRSTHFKPMYTSWAIGFVHKDGRHAGSVAPFAATSAYYVNPSTKGAEGIAVDWPIGQWFKVRLERDVATSTVRFYINGSLQATVTDTDTDPIDGFGVGWQSCCLTVGGGDMDSLTVTYTPVCQPSCSGKTCGDDGCGGSCGTCTTAGWFCGEAGTCQPAQGAFCNTITSTGQCFGGTLAACTPQKTVDLKDCAAAGQACSFVQASGKYDCVCVPSCAGKSCGSNGCGGSCGTCSGQTLCGAVTAGQCGCKEPPVVDNVWTQGFEEGICGFDLSKFATVLGMVADDPTKLKLVMTQKAAHSGQYGVDNTEQVTRQLYRAFDPVANVATIEAWFKGPTVMIGFAHADDRHAGFFHVTDSWNGGTRYANPKKKDWEPVSVSWETSSWTLVRAERDSSTGTFRLYMNGVLKFEKVDGDTDLLSGAFIGLPQYPGFFDDVRVTAYPFGCTPSCVDKACGDDGCGGSCGSCPITSGCGGDLVPGECACAPDPILPGAGYWVHSFNAGNLCTWDEIDRGLDWATGKLVSSTGTNSVSFSSIGAWGARHLLLQTKGLTGSGQYLLVKHLESPVTYAYISLFMGADTMTQAEHSGFVFAFVRKDGSHVGAFEFDATGKGAFYNPVTLAATPLVPTNPASGGGAATFTRDAATGTTKVTFGQNVYTVTDADTEPFDGFAFGLQTSFGGLSKGNFSSVRVETKEKICADSHSCALGGDAYIQCAGGVPYSMEYCPSAQRCNPDPSGGYCTGCVGGGSCTTCVKSLPLPAAGCTSALAGAVATASSAQDGRSPSSAIDGNVCDGWTAITGAPAAWQVDLPNAQTVSVVTLVPALSKSGIVRVLIDTRHALGQWVTRLDVSRVMAHGQPYHLVLPTAQVTTGVRVRTVSMPTGQPAGWLEVGVSSCP